MATIRMNQRTGKCRRGIIIVPIYTRWFVLGFLSLFFCVCVLSEHGKYVLHIYNTNAFTISGDFSHFLGVSIFVCVVLSNWPLLLLIGEERGGERKMTIFLNKHIYYRRIYRLLQTKSCECWLRPTFSTF